MAGWQCFSVSGEWTKETAGGCRNHPTHLNNPQYLITASTNTRVKVQVIQSQKDFDQLGVYLLRTQESQAKLVRSDVDDIVSKSDFISSEEAHLDAVLQPEARYVILPCTFDPAHEGKFEIRVYSDNDVYIEELASLPSVTIKGAWESDTAGGCVNHLSWRDNPQFFLEVKEKCALTLRLTQHEQERRSIGFYVVLSDGIKKLVLEPADIIAKATFQNTRDVICDVTLEPRDMPYIIIPATFRPHEYGKFSISIFGQHGFNPSGSVALFPCREKWYSVSVKGEWKGSTAGGCRNHATCSNNPQYLLTANSARKIVILLSQDKLNSQSIGFYVCKRNDEKGKTKRLAKVLKKHVIAKAYPFRNDREVDCSFECQQDTPYYIIPCTFEPGCERSFELTAYFDVEGGCSLQAI
ncbi:calpain 7 [Balamuthia mandrillaris]